MPVDNKLIVNSTFERILQDAIRGTCGTATYTSLLIADLLNESVSDIPNTVKNNELPKLILSKKCIYWIHDYVRNNLEHIASEIIKSSWEKFLGANYSSYYELIDKAKFRYELMEDMI